MNNIIYRRPTNIYIPQNPIATPYENFKDYRICKSHKSHQMMPQVIIVDISWSGSKIALQRSRAKVKETTLLEAFK